MVLTNIELYIGSLIHDDIVYNIKVEQIKAWDIANKYYITFGMAIFICRKNSERFEELLRYNSDKIIQNALNACIDEEWHEGTVILEKEVARRGLYIENVERRFDL